MATLSLDTTGILGAIAGVVGAAVGATVALNRVGAGAASVAMAVGVAVAGMAVAVALGGGVATGMDGIAVGAGVAGMAVGAGAGWGAGAAAGVAVGGAGASVASSPPQATIMAVAKTARIRNRQSLEGGKIRIEVASRKFLWGAQPGSDMRMVRAGLSAKRSLSCWSEKGKWRDVGDSFPSSWL